MSLLVDESPEAQRLRCLLEDGGNYRTLRRIELKTTTREECEALRGEGAAPLVQALLVDCEATGVDPTTDKLLSFSGLPIWYDRDTGEIAGAGDCQTWYHDPQEPISEKITELTGITNEMVEGRSLDVPAITEMIRSSAICIAHYAEYDRTLASRYILECGVGHWACSVNEIRWKERGYRRSSLIDLLADNGYFYTAHRSDTDCMALATLLSTGDSPPLGELLQNARNKSCTLHIGCEYAKDHLPHIREKGFLWDAKKKQWHKTFPADDVMSEISGFLTAAGDSVTPAHVRNASIVIKTSKTRYINDGVERGSPLPKETVAGMFADSGFVAGGNGPAVRHEAQEAQAPTDWTQSSSRQGRMSIPSNTASVPPRQEAMALSKPEAAPPSRSLFRPEP